MTTRPLIAALLIALTPLPVLAQAAAPVLTLNFSGIREPQGKVMVAIFDEAGWAGGAPVRVGMAEVTGTTATLNVEGLAPGRYAVKSFHDADGDGRMGTNPFGMPTEQFGFSNDAMGDRGPPAWADAAFEVGADGAVQSITLR